MSNDTQVAALMALVEEYANAWRDWGAREDGQNGMIAARAAVEASARQLAEQAAPGFVVVPVEPTQEMLQQGKHALYDESMGDFDASLLEIKATYRAMIQARPLTAAPIPEASGDDEREALNVITKCCAALAEELSAWDIDPPLHHVAEAHDLCERWLATRAQKGKA